MKLRLARQRSAASSSGGASVCVPESLPFGRDNADTQALGQEAFDDIATELKESVEPVAVPSAPTVTHQFAGFSMRFLEFG